MNVIELVNNKIIEKLEQGVNPWIKPWRMFGSVNLTAPANYKTGEYYTGINRALLETDYYLTYNQAKELGGNVKKGAHSKIVIYFSPIEKNNTENEKNESKKQFILKYYNVFSISDCEGIRNIQGRELTVPTDAVGVSPISEIEEIITKYIQRTNLQFFCEKQNKAYYSVKRDMIMLPELTQFDTIEGYYSIVFHELAHSTGHPARLNRKLESITGFGSNSYSKEELIAEIASAYCISQLGLANDATLNNNTAYLQNWAEHLKGNTASWFIMTASTAGAAAYSYIFGDTLK